MFADPEDLIGELLRIPSGPDLVNFYRAESDLIGGFTSGAEDRLAVLRSHLYAMSRAQLVIVGEAAGWRGARQSGLPFTSPLHVGFAGTSEASASVVQRELAAFDTPVLLWNALPLHPHLAGNPRSNRTPNMSEVRRGAHALQLATQGRVVLCIGGTAARAVSKLLHVSVVDSEDVIGGERAIALRHPSFGGANIFRQQFRSVVGALRLS